MCIISKNYFNVCTLHLVQFIIQTNKCTTYILVIFYILEAHLHILLHLHHVQRVFTSYFAKVTKLLTLQLNKISRLKCSHDRCWMIKYILQNVNDYNTWKLFVWWPHVQSGQSCGCNPCVGVSSSVCISWICIQAVYFRLWTWHILGSLICQRHLYSFPLWDTSFSCCIWMVTSSLKFRTLWQH